MGPGSQPRTGRIGERGSAVVAVLILLAATLLVVVGARYFGGAAAEQFRCQGDAVRAIGSGSAPGCGGAGQRAGLGGSRLHGGSGSEETSRRELRPKKRPHEVASSSADQLAPLFDIVASGVEAAAQNQVTEEEFDTIVDFYDHVRQGLTSIQPTEEAEPYWETIMADLALILQTAGGRALLGRLGHHAKWTLISVGYRKNEDGEPDPALGLDTSNAETLYDGRSIGLVSYAPGEWVRIPGVDLELDPWAVWRSDVALYHELVHDVDNLDGTGDPRTLAEQGVTFSAMEYQAVGLGAWLNQPVSENAYRAARREIGELGTGAAFGDADMPDRPHYIPRLQRADPPGPRPRPGGPFGHLDDR